MLFVGEEDGESGAGTMRLLVDPIDGTRAFLRDVPTWSVLVGLVDEVGPALGVAFMPAAGDLFVGLRGGGATGNGRPLRVSQVDALADTLVCHGSLDQFEGNGRMSSLDALARHTYSQRGFSDFDGYRQLLWGRCDAMVDPGVRPWDVCAAAVLVTEAGGQWSDLTGAPIIDGDGFVASNGHVHGALLGLL